MDDIMDRAATNFSSWAAMADGFPASHVLVKSLRLEAPQTLADVAALTAVGLVSLAYLLRGTAWDKPDPYHHILFERMGSKAGASMAPRATRNIAQKLEESGKDAVIFWGSQSGTAEMFAHRLAKECHLRFGLQPLTADLSDYDSETIALIPRTKLAIFILSTYGEGDPSDNATAFWEWLHRQPGDIKLPNLRYMAFGLGNTNYRYYNKVVDSVVEVLDKAGAERLMPVGKADDASGGTEEDFLAWKDGLYGVFTEKLGFQERDIPYTPSVTIVEDDSLSLVDLNLGEPVEHLSGLHNTKTGKFCSPIRALNVQSAKELYTSPTRSCLHLELDITNHGELRYSTGDHLAIYPINPDNEVQSLLAALGWETRADRPVLVQPVEKEDSIRVPSPTTFSALFRHYLEVCAPVSRETVGTLAQFAPTNEAKSFLSSLGKDKDAYAAFVTRNHVTMSRLLSLAAPGAIWKDLPLSYIIETVPSIQPRYYSISSTNAVSPRRIAITAGVDTTPLPTEPPSHIHGVTTNYLSVLANSLNKITAQNKTPNAPTYAISGPGDALEGHKVYACLRKSHFRLPVLASTPVIMIASGTGIAPFRAFSLERARLQSVGKPVGRMLLFFGCRRAGEDFLYREELEQATKAMKGLLEIVPAFSRASDMPKTYVQDKVMDKGLEVCELLGDGATVYICGRASMARDVGRVVEDVMKKGNNWNDDEVRSWGVSVKKSNKWLEDVWG